MFGFLLRIFRRNYLSRQEKKSLQEFFGYSAYKKLFRLYKENHITAAEMVAITPPSASVLIDGDILSLYFDGFFSKDDLLGITAESASALTNTKVRSLLSDGVLTKDFILKLNRTSLKALNARCTVELLLGGYLSANDLPMLSYPSLSVLDDNILPLVRNNILDVNFILNVSERIAIGLKGDAVKELLKVGYLKQDDLFILSDNAFKLLQCHDVVTVLLEKPEIIAKEELFSITDDGLDKLQNSIVLNVETA